MTDAEAEQEAKETILLMAGGEVTTEEAIKILASRLRQTAERERERCAQIAERVYTGDEGTNSYEFGDEGPRIARAIRREGTA